MTNEVPAAGLDGRFDGGRDGGLDGGLLGTLDALLTHYQGTIKVPFMYYNRTAITQLSHWYRILVPLSSH